MRELIVDNLFEGIPATLSQELTTTLLQHSNQHANLRIERIVSQGQCSAPDFWYEQTEHEWVLLISGSATLHFADDDRRVEIKPGDYLHIPAGARHRVDQTAADGQSVWLCIFYSDSG